MLTATQPDSLLQRPRAIGVEGDAGARETLRESRDGEHLVFAMQDAALELEILEAVARLRCLRQAYDGVRRERLFVAQPKPVVLRVAQNRDTASASCCGPRCRTDSPAPARQNAADLPPAARTPERSETAREGPAAPPRWRSARGSRCANRRSAGRVRRCRARRTFRAWRSARHCRTRWIAPRSKAALLPGSGEWIRHPVPRQRRCVRRCL